MKYHLPYKFQIKIMNLQYKKIKYLTNILYWGRIIKRLNKKIIRIRKKIKNK